MTEQPTLVGSYDLGQYVLLPSERDRECLTRLGHFGRDLEHAKEKVNSRRGPIDDRLIRLDAAIPGKVATVLTLSEAFYLAYALGCLTIRSDSAIITLDSCWHLFRQYYSETNSPHDFAIEYGLYHYFRSRGWVVHSGENYGANFLLYKEGPSIDHAHYAVSIFLDKAETEANCKWETLITFSRVLQSVSKEFMLAHVLVPPGLSFDRPECIKEMRIITRIFSAHPDISS